MAIEQWGSLCVPHLLWHGHPIIMVISEDQLSACGANVFYLGKILYIYLHSFSILHKFFYCSRDTWLIHLSIYILTLSAIQPDAIIYTIFKRPFNILLKLTLAEIYFAMMDLTGKNGNSLMSSISKSKIFWKSLLNKIYAE